MHSCKNFEFLGDPIEEQTNIQLGFKRASLLVHRTMTKIMSS